ncbi:MAG: hypothetical protein M3N13_02945 [Candidatus Eremiobacteraeota bacterium]|nr:hypothetical protein [Candidatus Eremiobacteraeota bacterium]
MNIRDRLRGDERRQLGTSDSVSSDILRRPEGFVELFEAFFDEDPVVRIRAADAAEKATRGRPDLLVPFRRRLISEAGSIEQPEVRRNIAQMLPRIKLEAKERAKAIALLQRYLLEGHPALVLAAMQSLTDFSNDDAVLREKMIPLLERFSREASDERTKFRARQMFARLTSQQNRRGPGAKPRR